MELVTFVVIISIPFAVYYLLQLLRRKKLLEKYGDAVLVDKLMRHLIFEGQTAEQLIDSRGRPIEVDNKVMKSKVREIWKYQKTSRKRFALRVTIENGIVVGWDQKA